MTIRIKSSQFHASRKYVNFAKTNPLVMTLMANSKMYTLKKIGLKMKMHPNSYKLMINLAIQKPTNLLPWHIKQFAIR